MTPFDQHKITVTGHSAVVKMTLHIGSASYRVRQSSNDAIKLAEFQPIPSGEAILETTVDGRVHRRHVRVLADAPRQNWIGIADLYQRPTAS